MATNHPFNVFLCWFLAAKLALYASTTGTLGAPQIPAMFVFGDSLVDDGNNNIGATVARSNFYPYGIDFFQGPTGRFSNGKTIADVLCKTLRSFHHLELNKTLTRTMMGVFRWPLGSSLPAGTIDCRPQWNRTTWGSELRFRKCRNLRWDRATPCESYPTINHFATLSTMKINFLFFW